MGYGGFSRTPGIVYGQHWPSGSVETRKYSDPGVSIILAPDPGISSWKRPREIELSESNIS